MNAVTTPLACAAITPGEAATIAGVLPRRRSPAATRCGWARDDVEDEDIDDAGPLMIATRRRRRPTATIRRRVPIQPGGKILL
jgi:hypothetical protein